MRVLVIAGRGFPATPATASAVAELITNYGKLPVRHLGRRYHNIAWMEPIEAVRPAYHAMQSGSEPIEDGS